ncbi:hypothetical protein HPDFL43_05675 [Hoeflea phototrophica DFL-43]|uniref:Uncharacterized protein n=1 Tax=Hoeflea phototrophica (strain DSM 17068 / NCIMB 14078 / DFL-43) TaxID=411684 RepID=A9D4N5_HOEPD|nr:hypothetical protein [Hoeflea phototrophica]EDQ33918.1 hypothetical protein HPDFL43_05675 [Hoeflea phototrophica DFL-43]
MKIDHFNAVKTLSEQRDAALVRQRRLQEEPLRRGGIIGSVAVVDVVTESDSRWFFGPRGLVLADPEPCDLIPAIGALGYFAWQPVSPDILPAPNKWMLPAGAKAAAATAPQPTLL